MPEFLRRNSWRLGAALLVITGVSAAFLMLRNSTSEAFPGMPPAERAYWEWVSSINQDRSTALESGFALLSTHPELNRLYPRLAEVCRELEREEECRGIFAGTQPSDERTALYRDAALAQLSDSADAWMQIAESRHLDPALARAAVDHARLDPESSVLGEMEASWERALSSDSALVGAAFGLGYGAVLRNDWDRAAPLLMRVTRHAPGDVNAYREFGRMYYFTGDYDKFVVALERGIDNARRQHDIEGELILRGNLGLGYLQWRGDLEKAGEMFEAALKQSTALSIRREEGINYYRLANVRGRQHRYTEALALLDSAEVRYLDAEPRRISQVLVLRGMVLNRMLRFSDAQDQLTLALAKAEENGDIPGKAEGLMTLVQLEYRMGDYRAAQRHGLEAVAFADKYRMGDFAVGARSVLGDVERQLGNIEAARTLFQQGLEIAQQSENATREREMYQQLGITALRLGESNAAQEYFELLNKSAQITGNPIGMADALYWIGNTYADFGNYAESVRYYDLALEALPDLEAFGLEGSILRMKASSLVHLDRMDEALAILQRARDLVGDDVERQYILDVVTGQALVANGDFRRAIEYFESAEAIEDEWQFSASHWEALSGEALAYWGLGEREKAERAFRESISIIETLRDNLSSADDRAYFLHNKVSVYDNFSAFLEEDGRDVEAFSINERVRSRTLVDLLYTTQQSRSLELTDVTDRAMEMNRRVRAIENELFSEMVEDGENEEVYRADRLTYLRRERQRADSVYKALESGLFGSQRIYSFHPVDVDSVQAVLGENEALIAFNLRTNLPTSSMGAGSSVYIVLKSQVIKFPLPEVSEELRETVRFFRDAIGTHEGSSWRVASRRLYDILMASVVDALPSHIEHLHVVPEGILHYLPFAALLDESGTFLVERYTVSVSPSATILKLSRETNPRRWSYILLLADPDGRLPGARKEVVAIASESSSRRHVLVGSDASQATLESVASNYDILHFATHGNFISRAPWNSHLELHDDILTVEEIGKLDLDAYLVTLSACETALSSGLTADIPNGDEWVGFNQAFLAAGTPTVMASLWPIDDAVSSRFMVDFYDRLGPRGKAFALAQVQRDFLQSRKTAHPFYWAAFSVVGDPL